MSKSKIFFLASAVVGLFSLFSCTKNNNTTVTVKDSVYYSPWLNISMSPTNAGDTAYTGQISASRLTQSILSSGAVLTYLGAPGQPSAGDTAAESAVDYGLYSELVPGSITLLSFGYLNDFSTSNSALLYRYVIVPGSVLETTGMTAKELQSKSYTAAVNYITSAAQKVKAPGVQ